MEKKINSFLQLKRFLAGIPEINEGGCGIAAYIMQKWLKSKGIPAEIVYLYNNRYDKNFLHNQNQISKEEILSHACSHAGVLVKGKFQDCNGISPLSDAYHVLSEEDCLNSINNGIWNPEFYRGMWIPIIEERVKINLNAIIK